MAESPKKEEAKTPTPNPAEAKPEVKDETKGAETLEATKLYRLRPGKEHNAIVRGTLKTWSGDKNESVELTQDQFEQFRDKVYSSAEAKAADEEAKAKQKEADEAAKAAAEAEEKANKA